MSWGKRILLALLALVVIGIAAFLIWAWNPARPTERAINALTTAESVDDAWVFGDTTAATGLILYPGGHVEAGAYASVAAQIADAGYLVIVPEVTLNLAVFDLNRADAILAAYPNVESWAIGGHSLGGAMAAQYTSDHLDEIEGLILWASYPGAANDLSAADIVVASVYGTQDGLATVDNIDAYRHLLPDDTNYVAVEGGNHAQFGDYGEQRGDLVGKISTADQQAQITAATIDLLSIISD